MTGSERAGFRNANSVFLENAYYVLTPEEESDPKHVAALQELIVSLGALPMVLTAKAHDRAVAGISHLPHLVSAQRQQRRDHEAFGRRRV